MITDRTPQDVELAKTLRLKLQSGETLTIEETEQLERGSCTVTMLNRIEGKTKELADILKSYSYIVDVETKTDWNYDDIFLYNDYKRILDNINKIKYGFSFIQETTLPQYLYGYKEANLVETVLSDEETLLYNMINSFVYMGDNIYMGAV